MERVNDTVQPPSWADELPRAWFRGREKIVQSQPWFDVYRLPCGSFALYEPGHFQEVISYLLIGEEKALLWDTGMGMGDIARLARELTDLPLIVLNSHTHFDHMGGNADFSEIHVLDHPVSLARAAHGLDRAEVAEHTTPDQLSRELPPGFVLREYEIRPARAVVPMREGDVFDLGGRKFEVLHTPGHSPESVMLLDRENALLLTGDTFYPATLYAHLDAGDGMASEFSTYRRTMARLARELAFVKTLYCSHNEPIVPGSQLAAAAEAFEAIANGRPADQADAYGLRKHQLNGFAIVVDSSI